MTWPLLLVIFLPLLAVPVVLTAGKRLGRRTGYLAMVFPLTGFITLAWLALQLGERPRAVFELPWIPTLDVQLAFLVDGLSILFGFIVTGMGALICWYGAEYLGDKYESHDRFYAYLLLFMSAMLGTVFSDNLLLLFVFWELTGVASFLLIGFLHSDPVSRVGARKALLVTAFAGLALMAGLIMLGLTSGTYSLDKLLDAGLPVSDRGAGWLNAMLLLILVGAFGKSAQFPFFFWLPAAMAAPTPVSAYLHSATMVKMGVFLTARIFPIFHTHELWYPVITTVCFSTMLLGAFLALRSDDLKAILAYATVSQLGFLIGFYGLGSSIGVRFDFVHILNHVFYKGCLFMVAGIVDHTTGIRDVRQLGGLARRMPLTSFACLVSAAALAGLPLTTGFISKEIILADLMATREMHPIGGVVLFAMMVLATLITVAFAARIFFKVFLGDAPPGLRFRPPCRSIQMPPLLLAVALVFFGIFPGLLANPLDRFAVAQLHGPGGAYLKLWHGFNFELLMSFLIILGGGGVYWWAERTQWRWTTVPAWLQFGAGFERGLDALGRFSKHLTRAMKAHSPPAYLPILISTLLLLFIGAAILGREQWSVNAMIAAVLVGKLDPLRAFSVLVISVAALGVVMLRRWTAQLVALSITGFLITFYYVLYRAPDLALTQILVESALVVMILLLLSRFPRASQKGVRSDRGFGPRRIFHLVLSTGVGLTMSALLLYANANRHPAPIGERHLELTRPLAGGTNAVNTILVDFRGFDTLGEIAVLLIAALGGMGLVMRFRRGKPAVDVAPPPGFLLEEEKQP